MKVALGASLCSLCLCLPLMGQEIGNLPEGVIESRGPTLVVDFDAASKAEIRLQQWLEFAHTMTGLNFGYWQGIPQVQEQYEGKVIRWVGTKAIPRDKVFPLLQTLLISQDLILIPQGAGPLQTWLIAPLHAPALEAAKANARFIPVEALGSFRDQPAVWIYTVVPLRFRSADRLGSALQAGMGRRQQGFSFHSLPGENAILVQGFGEAVAEGVQVLQQLDVPTSSPKAKAPAQPSQEPQIQNQGDYLLFKANFRSEGALNLRDLIALCEEEGGQPFTLDASLIHNPSVLDTPVTFFGDKKVEKTKLFAFTQTILKVHGLVCLPTGSGESAMIRLAFLDNLSPRRLMGAALLVDWREVEIYRDQTATYLATIVPLENIHVQTLGQNLRAAYHGDGFMPLPSESALMVHGFGPFVAEMVAELRKLNQPEPAENSGS